MAARVVKGSFGSPWMLGIKEYKMSEADSAYKESRNLSYPTTMQLMGKGTSCKIACCTSGRKPSSAR